MTQTGSGKLRVYYADNQETYLIPVWESRSEPLNPFASGASIDPRMLPFIPLDPRYTWKRDDKIILQYYADSTTSVNNTSVIRLPITRKNVNTGAKYDAFLVASDFGLTSTDVTLTASVWSRIGQYVALGQEEIRLGCQNSVNSQVFMNLQYT